jgi:RHS repeat-associated protein
MYTHDDVLGQNTLQAGAATNWTGFDTRANSVGIDLEVVQDVTKIQILTGNPDHRLSKANIEVWISDTNEHGSFTEAPVYDLIEPVPGLLELSFYPAIQGQYIKVHSLWDERDEYYSPIDNSTVESTPDALIKVFYNAKNKRESYTYDEMGNRLSSTVDLEGIAKTRRYTYKPFTNLILSNGIFEYAYDDAGNMVSKTQLIDEASTGDSWSYSYDLLNRLVAVVTPETTVSYRYNHLGLRVTKEKSETNESWVYQYGAEQEVVYEEHLEDGNRVELTLKYFVLGKAYAEERVEEGTRYFYHHDHLGSVIALSDESGALVWEGDYNVFGQLDSQKGSVDFGGQYTSKNLDPDTGLYYYNARWMDPDLGRFITEDPARDGQNWYAYVGNNPLMFVDPSGLNLTDAPRGPVTALINSKQEDLGVSGDYDNFWAFYIGNDLNNFLGIPVAPGKKEQDYGPSSIVSGSAKIDGTKINLSIATTFNPYYDQSVEYGPNNKYTTTDGENYFDPVTLGINLDLRTSPEVNQDLYLEFGVNSPDWGEFTQSFLIHENLINYSAPYLPHNQDTTLIANMVYSLSQSAELEADGFRFSAEYGVYAAVGTTQFGGGNFLLAEVAYKFNETTFISLDTQAQGYLGSMRQYSTNLETNNTGLGLNATVGWNLNLQIDGHSFGYGYKYDWNSVSPKTNNETVHLFQYGYRWNIE